MVGKLQNTYRVVLGLGLAALLSGCVAYTQAFEGMEGDRYSTRSVGLGYRVDRDNNNLTWVWDADGSGSLEITKTHEGMDALEGFKAGLSAGQSLGAAAIQAVVPLIQDAVRPREEE